MDKVLRTMVGSISLPRLIVGSMIIRNGAILHGDRLEEATSLRTEAGRITAIAKDLSPEPGEQVLDATGCCVLPGLIDLHNHGVRHVMAQYDSLVEYARLLAAEGVTACLPTLLGSPQENVAAMRRGLAETEDFRLAPNLIGFRPEITYLAKTGAGAAGSLTKISAETTEALYAASRGTIRIWDVSPELDGAIPFIRWCRERGIVTSLAHSSATIEQAQPGHGRGPESDHPLLRHLRSAADDRSRRLSCGIDRLHPGGRPLDGRNHSRWCPRPPAAGGKDAPLQGTRPGGVRHRRREGSGQPAGRLRRPLPRRAGGDQRRARRAPRLGRRAFGERAHPHQLPAECGQ